ncbi:MAG: PCRF domain-containing protein, partial [Pseudomonadales bacterium]
MPRSGGIFDFEDKQHRLEEIDLTLADPDIWDDPEKARALNRERVQLDAIVGVLAPFSASLNDLAELAELSAEDDDADSLAEVASELDRLEEALARLEFRRMFQGEMDPADAYLEIQAGSGGTEAQDWAEMLLRMYLRWGESRDFETEIIEVSPGEIAGIKSATVHFSGDHAFGWLRTETGVHRLVRKSPFDSG